MKEPDAIRVLANLLRALEAELLTAGDDEVLQAAADLGIKPDMKGSIALLGVTQLVLRPGQLRDMWAARPDAKAAPARTRRRREGPARPRKE